MSRSPLGGLSSFVEQALRFKCYYPVAGAVARRRSLDRSALRRAAEARDAIWYGPPEEPIEIEPPTEPILREAYEPYPMAFDPARPFVCELEDCLVLGPFGTILTSDDELVAETVDWSLREFVTMDRYASTRWDFFVRQLPSGRSPNERLDIDAFPMISSDSSYYHWVMECLPKLRNLARFEDRTGRRPTIVVETEPSSFVRESLALAGYGPDRWIEIDDVEGRRVRSAVVSIHRSHLLDHIQPSRSPYAPSPTDVRWVRDRMRTNADGVDDADGGEGVDDADGGDDAETPDRIYVSRQGASRGRRVQNYDEVVSELEDRGFESCTLEALSFEEQVRLFSDCEIVLGPTGAGFTNAIFGDDLLLVELIPGAALVPDAEIPPYFYYLARIVGFEHEALITGGDREELVVDLDTFRSRLDDLEL